MLPVLVLVKGTRDLTKFVTRVKTLVDNNFCLFDALPSGDKSLALDLTIVEVSNSNCYPAGYGIGEPKLTR